MPQSAELAIGPIETIDTILTLTLGVGNIVSMAKLAIGPIHCKKILG